MQFPARTVRPPGLGLEFDVLAGDAIIGPAIEKGSWSGHETELFLAHLRPGDRVLGIADVAARNIERATAKGPGRGVLHRAAAGDRPGRARIALAPANHGDN